MTEEQKQQQQEQPVEQQEQPVTDAPQLRKVDVFGVELELPDEVASRVIAKRDEKINGYKTAMEELNEIKSKEAQARLEAEEERRKNEALSAMKNQDMEKTKELLTKEYQDKLKNYESHTFRSSVRSELLSRDDLVDGVIDDAINNIMLNNTFSLNDDFSVSAGDKKVADLVNDYVESRPYMKKAPGNKPLHNPKAKELKPEKDTKAAFRKGLEKLIG